jgi:hypothetical protein
VADIFQEVDDDVRQDRLNRLWKKYAPALIGLAVLVVAATAGVTGYRYYVNSERERASDALIAAQQLAVTGDRAGAIKALDALALDAREPYATLARLRSAALRAENGDAPGAIAAYNEVARTAQDKDIRELASVLAAIQGAGATPPEERIAKLMPLADGGGAWQNVAREYLGYLLFKMGDGAGARQVWQQISQDTAASEALKSRALELLSATGGVPAPAPAAPPAAPPASPVTPPAPPAAAPDTKGK